jgi:hypothetical protein
MLPAQNKGELTLFFVFFFFLVGLGFELRALHLQNRHLWLEPHLQYKKASLTGERTQAMAVKALNPNYFLK